MPNYWCSLPKEILDIIFLYVKASDKTHNKDLALCVLTCRCWSALAQNALFSEIYVNTTNNIDSLTPVALERKKSRNWVKVLKYTSDFECTSMTLFGTDLLFPNLETLSFFGNNLLYSYFCKMLVENKKFKNLRILPIPANKEQDAIYIQCLNFLQERATSITLFDGEVSNRNLYQDLIYQLDKFPKLTKVLVFTTTTSVQYQNLIKHINPIVENNLISSLQELCITSTVDDSYCFRLFTQGQKFLFPMMELKSLNVYMYNEICRTVESDLMLFIIKQCPNLNNLCIENQERYRNKRGSIYQTFFQFIIYLSRIPNFFLQNSMLYREEAAQIIKKFYTAIEKEPILLNLTHALFITVSPLISNRNGFAVISFESNFLVQLQSVEYEIVREWRSVIEVDQEQIQVIEKIGHFLT